MTIARLAPHANDLTVTLTVTKALRPYFTEWYQATKQDGDTPETFVMRIMKAQAASYYINKEMPAQMEAIEAVKNTEMQTIAEDSDLLRVEMDG